MIKSRIFLSTENYIMVNITQVIAKDLNHIWHPCMQMKDFETYPPLVIHEAKGSYLYTDQGRLIDGISSWWCKSLGHGHPAIVEAIKQQLKSFEQVIAANTTHPLLAEFGEKIADITHKQHVFFASDGSSAVEIAMKLALHAMQIRGETHRRQFIALSHAYHGETLATISVSDLGLYKKPYAGYGVQCHFIQDIPYVQGNLDPLWHDCEKAWQTILPQLETIKDQACAVIVEPLVQGAGGMLCYSADFLNKLARWAKDNGLYFIADEIMTGMGRTGQWLACQWADVEPDLVCLSKGLTAGALPLSCVAIDHSIYTLFYDEYDKGKSFLHSHTHSGNALAVSAALATIKVMETEGINEQARVLGELMHSLMLEIAETTGKLSRVRSLGAIAAADMEALPGQRISFRFYQEACQRGALLRPLGNTLYWLPPLNADEKTIRQLAEITLNSLYGVYNN
ncbi:adenosylmethionine-8-amino-7-oxononanoate aminotransferase [Legionella erythra]|uniref:adenosylmethionine--8-amino-7-oxononanoate transaminase n=2 Tax=Legionella erythra TaxID=448 RepID=A0A0W0TRC1_LEGER|nr:adenosylmethionine-8-amino-7-oxononanoate aminotransferase [Legionella erythra]